MRFFRMLPLLWLVFPLSSQADDKDFLLAREAWQRNDQLALTALIDAMRDDSLRPYAEYYLLNRQLPDADNARVLGFLQKYPGTPLAEKLRGEWLRLVAKRGDWATFNSQYTELRDPDQELQCRALESRGQGGDTSALREARQTLWLSTRPLPEACQGILGLLDSQKRLDKEDYWARLRLMLQAGNNGTARQLAGQLGYDLKPALLVRIANQPLKYLAKPDVETRLGHELYLAALARLSRQNIDQALKTWQQVTRHFDTEDRAYGWRILAVSGARQQDTRAVEWFRQASAGFWPDSDREWQLRIAIRARDWPMVLDAIAQLPTARQQERCWLYWRAHALLEQKQQPDTVRALLTMLANDDDYYGLLARDHLSTPLAAAPPVYRPTPEDLQRFNQMPGMERALRLYTLDARPEAVREWNWALRNADDKLLLAAAEKAVSVRWYDRAIYAAERTKQLHSYSLRYLTPYQEVAQSYANEFGVDPAWVYGLIRQESRFVTDARSGVGAGGLMQLMPTTAQWVANRLKIPYHRAMVNEVGTNIRLGTYYLSVALKNLGNQPVLATAGYNAGPNRARQWQDATQPLDADIYVESIPFVETRDYVKKVMTNAVHYAIGFGQGPQSISTRMGVIPPRAAKDIPGP